MKEKSLAVFHALALAEARTHGVTVDTIHFHEVGAIDSIIDTVGCVYALHLLEVDLIYCSKIPFGEGMTGLTAHGILPVPAPATMRLLLDIPLCQGPPGYTGELVTPTGAALLRALVQEFGRPPPFIPRTIGIGAGKKDFPKHANIVRVILGDLNDGKSKETTLSSQITVDKQKLYERNNSLSQSKNGENHEQQDRCEDNNKFLIQDQDKTEMTGKTTRINEDSRKNAFEKFNHDSTIPVYLDVCADSKDHDNSNCDMQSNTNVERTNPVINVTAMKAKLQNESITDCTTNKDCKVIIKNDSILMKELYVIECNIDDTTSEQISYISNIVLLPVSLDTWITPILMKKGRPAFLLSVLCTESNLNTLLELIFTQTSTLGVRIQTIQRAEIERFVETIQHPKYGTVSVKVGFYNSEPVKIKAEYEMCREISQKMKVPLKTVQEETVQYYLGKLEKSMG